MVIDKVNYQTRPDVADFMASLLPDNCGTILEPTPGAGNLVNAAWHKGKVTAPDLFEDIPKGSRFDWAIMNPPFTPMKLGYQFLVDVMEMTDNIVALLPWFIYINSDRRSKHLQAWGIVKVIHLPRNVFPGTRIQCCILVMSKGYEGTTELNHYSIINNG